MTLRPGGRALVAGLIVLSAVAACSQAAPPAAPSAAPTSAIEGVTPVGGSAFTPTETVGGSAAVTDLAKVFAGIPQATQLTFTGNASPPGATGADVSSISIVAQDGGGALKSLDASGKRMLGEALLNAAATAWPNAGISLLISSPTGGGTIVGNRPKGGPNTVLAS